MDAVHKYDVSGYKFTGKERDSESGLDNFGKRYDASSLGRFITPDAFYKDSHVGDPQSWNEYAYARTIGKSKSGVRRERGIVAGRLVAIYSKPPQVVPCGPSSLGLE